MRAHWLVIGALACRTADKPTEDTDLVEGDADADSDADSDADADADSDADADPLWPTGTGCAAPIESVDTSSPDRVVGDGTSASCTEAALRSAVELGGTVRLDCGPDPHTIQLQSPLAPTVDVVIDGQDLVTLSGGGSTRIVELDTGNFEATGPLVTVQGLTFADGVASGTAIPLGTDIDGGGGAIWHRGGGLRVIECVFTGNRGATSGPDVGGGAIYGLGLGENTIVRSVFTDNEAANGGAIGVLGGPLVVVDSLIHGNRATGEGANSVDDQGVQQGHGGNGGGICMDGQGQVLDLCGVVVQGNTGGAFGGGLFRTSYESEPSTFTTCSFLDNEVPPPSDPALGSGAGGLYLQGSTVTMTGSTVARNRAEAFAGMWVLAHGPAAARVDLTNVTIADNDVYPDPVDPELSGVGGGLTVGDGTTGRLWNVTIAGNTAGFGSGIWNVSPLELVNVILSNDALNVFNPLNCTGSAFSSPPGSGGPNLQWPEGQADMDCTPGIPYADPLIRPLDDYGGPTLTMLPDAATPGLGMGTDCPPTDQRGSPRPVPCALGSTEP